MNDPKRLLLFAPPFLVGLFLFSDSVFFLLLTESELYSHIPVVYAVFGYLVYRKRKEIFSDLHYSPLCGMPLLLLGCFVFYYGRVNELALGQNDTACALSLGFILFAIGLFICIFGMTAYRKMLFPGLFLFFAVPIPGFLLSRITYYLQYMSFQASATLLDMLGFFPIREGFVIELPEVSVEVAEQCSGIRSSIALIIVTVLYAHVFLRTNRCKIASVGLALLIVPIKNGMRIATLVLLAIYWDKKVLAGPLHTMGGIPFFGIGLVWLGLVVLILAKIERRALRVQSRNNDKRQSVSG